MLKFSLFSILFLSALFCKAQIGIGTTTPNSSAILELQSSGKGFLIPRMQATQRLGIAAVNGLLVYDLDSSSLFVYETSAWKRLRSISNLESLISGTAGGDMLQWNGTNWVVVSTPAKYALTVTRVNGGETSVVSADLTGIYCGVDCVESYNSGSVVTLVATPGSGYTFSGWSGACSGTGICAVTMNAAKTVTATFTPSLIVAKTGTGSGTVTSTPAGINCGAICTAGFSNGTVVSLSAAPASNAVFSGWSGACSGAGSCVVTMDAVKNVTAIFTRVQYNLDVTKTGNGGGTITSSPAAISCGANCLEAFDGGTTVTLSAIADANSVFNGWSGACSGVVTCSVTMDDIKNVGADFSKPQYSLTAYTTGTGNVYSSPSGIVCQPACNNYFDKGTLLNLTPVPGSGLNFGDWSGDCSGPGSCNVNMDGNKSVTARFGYLLSISRQGGGGGTISSSCTGGCPPGISCGATCTVIVYNPGNIVTLTATPNVGGSFFGWTAGPCTGTGTCVVTMNQATNISAAFRFPLTVIKTGSGTVTGDIGSIFCGATCSGNYFYGDIVTLTAVPAGAGTFTGWGGACSGTGPCVVTINAAKSVNANFNP